jgi:hypothetical protein
VGKVNLEEDILFGHLDIHSTPFILMVCVCSIDLYAHYFSNFMDKIRPCDGVGLSDDLAIAGLC